MIKSWIWVTFQKEGIHCYPEAKNIPGVEFLASDHRHLFHFKIWLEVKHDNRDVEFIIFQRELEGLYKDEVLQLNYKSCEMMARDIVEYIAENYPERDIKVEVSEDGENGALLEASR